MMQFESISPISNSIVWFKSLDTPKSWQEWLSRTLQESSLASRQSVLSKLAELLRNQAEVLSFEISEEMGKPITQAKAEVLKCASALDWYAQLPLNVFGPNEHENGGLCWKSMRKPLGTILLIMPWNFPFWQVIRAAAPAYLAGNRLLLKHAPNVGRCARQLEKLFHQAGADPVSFKSIYVDIDQVEPLLADPRVNGVSLTGSTKAGKSVAALAGKYMKKGVFELGGSDPFIVLPEAPFEETIKGMMLGRLQNNGQSCIAAKRFLIPEKDLPEYLNGLTKSLQALHVSANALDPTVDVGPLARADLKTGLMAQLSRSEQQGVEVAFVLPNVEEQHPCLVAPRILIAKQAGTVARQEELFGPFFTLIPYSTRDEAIAIANETEYGLGASIWGGSKLDFSEMASRLNCGAVFHNEIVRSDARVPFGGIKDSGYGKELGLEGLFEFTYLQTLISA
jgi:succinate-semialdehyde dehydrogenase/glutarate-semialdehyde dehydrogenase